MNRRSSLATAWALIGAAGLSLFISGDSSDARNSALPRDLGAAKPGKSSPRSGAHQLSPQAAEAAIRNWLRSSADRSSPPLAACRALSAAAVERLLRDPVDGWSPLLNSALGEELPANWEATMRPLLPLHEALLKRWAEVDFKDALAKIPPVTGYNEDHNLAWVLFTEKAKTDPALASQSLMDWTRDVQRLPPFGTASHDVMKAWSAVDPESAWQWLANARPDENHWQVTAQGYVKGLAHPDWQELLEKAETLPRGEPNEANLRAGMRFEMIRAWGFEDPLAALASFDQQSADPLRNPHPDYPADPQEARMMTFSTLVPSWMRMDPGVAAKLQAWQPEKFDTDRVFRIVAINGIWPEATRQQARSLIRDPKIAAEVDTMIEQMRPSFLVPQLCSALHQELPPGQK